MEITPWGYPPGDYPPVVGYDQYELVPVFKKILLRALACGSVRVRSTLQVFTNFSVGVNSGGVSPVISWINDFRFGAKSAKWEERKRLGR